MTGFSNVMDVLKKILMTLPRDHFYDEHRYNKLGWSACFYPCPALY